MKYVLVMSLWPPVVTYWSGSTSNFYACGKLLCIVLKLVTLTAEAGRVLCQLVIFLTVFFHWMYKMKNNCYQESSFSFFTLLDA